MTVNWKRRIVRVSMDDDDEQRSVVIQAVEAGWILDAQAHGEGDTVDLVFRRAQPQEPRMTWS